MTGVMQGRLLPPIGDRIQSFPKGRWADEFPLAAAAGLDAIEWIDDIDADNDLTLDDNPIWSDAGIERLRTISTRHGVAVHSICADSLMKVRLMAPAADERREALARLNDLLDRARSLGVWRVVLPFVDASSIRTQQARERALESIRAVEPSARALGIQLHLETDLGPDDFATFLERLPADLVFVNYDSGNSASLGYDPVTELTAYGHRLGSVHVKDRVLGGTTVPLGTGDAKLPLLFELLTARHYQGPVILQAARGLPGDELATVTAQRRHVDALWGRCLVGER